MASGAVSRHRPSPEHLRSFHESSDDLGWSVTPAPVRPVSVRRDTWSGLRIEWSCVRELCMEIYSKDLPAATSSTAATMWNRRTTHYDNRSRSSWTNFGWTFLWKGSEAHACRRSWKVMRGRSAFTSSGAKERLRKLEGLMMPPRSPLKTEPWSW